MPGLLDATLMDDTPAANAETRAWISSLSQPTPSSDGAAAPVNGVPARNGFSSRWPSQARAVFFAAADDDLFDPAGDVKHWPSLMHPEQPLIPVRSQSPCIVAREASGSR